MKIKDKQELHQIFIKLKKDKKENIFNELYNKYSNLIYKIAFSLIKNKENSEDIKQIVMTKIWNMSNENLPENNETSWLYIITKNETLNYIRKQENAINLDEIYYISSEDKDINEVIDRDSYNKLISKLNKKEQEIISLKILANLSFKEISQILNIPIGTVQWKYYKSLHTLKMLLSSLSMYIITMIAFITQRFNKSSRQEQMEEILESEQENSEEQRQEETMKKDEIYNTNSNIENNNIDVETEMTTTVKQEESTNLTLMDIGILSISSIFLIITITFFISFIKSQQKAKKNVSK